MSQTQWLVFLLCVLIFALDACSGTDAPTPKATLARPTLTPQLTSAARPTSTPQPATPSAGPETVLPTSTPTSRPQGGAVIVGGLIDPITPNPLLADDEASLAVAGLVFDSLLAVDPWTDGLVPNLARAWRVSADGLTITFDLRDDVLWHDGEPFTAEDVEFTFEAIANISAGLSTGLGVDSPRRFDLALVEEFRALDAKTFLVKLSEPNCSGLYDLGLLPIVPRHLFQQQATTIGTGPFVFKELCPEPDFGEPVGLSPALSGTRGSGRRLSRAVEGWSQGNRITLMRNPRCWRRPPRLDARIYRVLADEEELLAELEAGHIDVAPIRPQDLARVEAVGHFEIYRYPAAEYYFIAFNNDHPVLGDRRVRQALSYALDREQLVDQILPGQGTLLAAGLLPGHWALRGGAPGLASTTTTLVGLEGFSPKPAGRIAMAMASWTERVSPSS